MEFLVTMTTHVPDGTTDEAVDEMRRREAKRARELAARGRLERLWRPPLQAGEWRSLGLFAAANPDQLEEVLASMPLRVWRTDEATPLSPHPNDPAAAPEPPGDGVQEFLTALTIAIPDGTPTRTVDDTNAREAERAHELAAEGHLLRLWKVSVESGVTRALGLWRAEDPASIRAMLESLPVSGWTAAEITPLTPHPNDPAIVAA